VTSQAIAVFDSGEGGLTVLKQARNLFPSENFIYAADSLHFPYGARSLEDVRRLFMRFLAFFVEQDAKAVVIACNTATAAALDEAVALSPVPVIGVVGPGAAAAVRASHNGNIGVLSTHATYKSDIYLHTITALNPSTCVVQHPCPALVTMAESGSTDSEQARRAVRQCLQEMFRHDVDTVVLGCTHFPHMEKIFHEEVAGRAQIIDPGYETAERLSDVVGASTAGSGGSLQFYTTGPVEEFDRISRILWPEIQIHAQPLFWQSNHFVIRR
jgi:glutamate racemase